MDHDTVLREIFGELFGYQGRLEEDLGPDTLAAWTSVRHLNLVLELEDRFGCHFSLEQIERLRSVGDIREVLQECAPR